MKHSIDGPHDKVIYEVDNFRRLEAVAAMPDDFLEKMMTRTGRTEEEVRSMSFTDLLSIYLILYTELEEILRAL